MNSALKEVLDKRIRTHIKVQTLVCIVVSVDEAACSCVCQPLNDDPPINDVRLRSLIDGADSGLVIFPSANSTVLVGLIDNNQNTAFIAQYSLVDKIYLGNQSNGGLVIASQVDKTNQLLNALLKIINGAPIDEPGNGSPSAFQKALSAAVTGQTLPSVTDLQNKNVLH